MAYETNPAKIDQQPRQPAPGFPEPPRAGRQEGIDEDDSSDMAERNMAGSTTTPPKRPMPMTDDKQTGKSSSDDKSGKPGCGC